MQGMHATGHRHIIKMTNRTEHLRVIFYRYRYTEEMLYPALAGKSQRLRQLFGILFQAVEMTMRIYKQKKLLRLVLLMKKSDSTAALY